MADFGQDDEIVVEPFGQNDPVVSKPTYNFGQNDEVISKPPVFDRESKLVDPTGRKFEVKKENPLITQHGDMITKEEILNRPEYMRIIRKGMQSRFGKGNRNSFAGDFRYDDDWDDEKLFEMWQNYQRSFAAGQTVTTANETAYLFRADDKEKSELGQMYMLFDAMPNITSAKMPWSDRFDSFWDYGKAAIYDPTTALGLGVGRLWGTAGAKAGGTALRVGAKKLGAKGLQKLAQKTGEVIGKGAVYTGVDIVQAIGTDIAYQNALIETEAQTEFSGAQTALSAAGVLVLPSLLAAGKGLSSLRSLKGAEKIYADKYIDIVETLGSQRAPDAVKNEIYKRMDMEGVADGMSDLMRDFLDNSDKYLDWTSAKTAASDAGFKSAEVGDQESIFFRSMLLGAPDASQPGLIKLLQDKGFVYVPRFDDDTFTNFITDVISDLDKYLPDEATKIKTGLTKLSENNPKIKNLLEQGEDDVLGNLALYMKRRTSDVARDLWTMKRGKELLGKEFTDMTNSDLIKLMNETSPSEKSPQFMDKVLWSQNIYKRLLTAHPGTTGLNLKGWSYTVAANNVSSVIEAGLHATKGGAKKIVGKDPTIDFQRASGSLLGAMRRGLNLFAMADTEEAAMKYFEVRPNVEDELMRWRSGGVKASSAADNLGLDADKFVYKNTEKVTSAIQYMSGVQIQDEITKRLSFITALDEEVMKAYGMTYNKFIQRDGAYVDMFTTKFHEVEARAINRALRETYSKSFKTGGDAQRWMRLGAKAIETISNKPGSGFYIPFGQFFNNSIATLGDYSGVNFIRHAAARGLGREIDVREEQGMELLAKGVVGLTALRFASEKAEEKIQEGLAWNQERRSDGSVADLTYEAPEAFLLAIGQVGGHIRRGEKVPPKLFEEVAELLYGQTFRAIGEAGVSVEELMYAMVDVHQGRGLDVARSVLSGAVSRPLSGATRFLDPINEAAILMKEDFSELDRRQGYEWFNNSVKYIDQIPTLFGADRGLVASVNEELGDTDVETRFDPIHGEKPHDPGRVLGGERSVPGPGPFESMMNSVGTRSWKEIRWNGPAKLKNRMDMIVEPYLNYHASVVMQEQDFFNMSLEQRQRWTQIVATRARDDAKKTLAGSLSGRDPLFNKIREIYDYPETKIDWAMKILGLEGKPEDYADPNKVNANLDFILDVLENQDEYMGISE